MRAWEGDSHMSKFDELSHFATAKPDEEKKNPPEELSLDESRFVQEQDVAEFLQRIRENQAVDCG